MPNRKGRSPLSQEAGVSNRTLKRQTYQKLCGLSHLLILMEPLLIRYAKKLVSKTRMFSSSEVILIDVRHLGFELVHITSLLDDMCNHSLRLPLRYCSLDRGKWQKN